MFFTLTAAAALNLSPKRTIKESLYKILSLDFKHEMSVFAQIFNGM
jgi:hypothetical protein